MPRPSKRNSKGGGLSQLKKEIREKEANLQREKADLENLMRSAPERRRKLQEEARGRINEIPHSSSLNEDRQWNLRANVAAGSPDSARPLRSELRHARAQFIILLLVLFGLLALILALLT